MNDNEIFCPLVRQEITRLTCEDVSLSAEGMQPNRFAPPEFQKSSDWKDVCMNCPKHSD